MAAAIAHFISLEMLDLANGVGRRLTLGREGAFVTVVRMETVVHMADEVFRSMEPGSRADEDAAIEPLRAIVAVGAQS